MNNKSTGSAALTAITKAKETFEKTIETHLATLKQEKKMHEDQAKEIGKLISKITGKTDNSAGGGRTNWTDTILKLLKSGPVSLSPINQACGGKNQYQKLERMVKDKEVEKVTDSSGGVTYKLK